MKPLRTLALAAVASALVVLPAYAATETPGDAADTASYTLVLPFVAADGSGPVAPAVPDPYPVGTRTGIPSLDTVLAALDAEDAGPLRALFALTPAPCVINPQSITNPPLCPDGTPAGTPVPVFRATSCESLWPDYLEEVLLLWEGPRRVLAIYRDPTDAYAWLPAAEYAIVVRGVNDPRGEVPAVVRVSAGRVNGIAFGCGQSFEEQTAGIDPGRYLLPPQW